MAGRVHGDGNCFFRATAQWKLLCASVPSGYMGNSQSMEDYMKESSMKYLKLWPSEAGIIVTAQCL